MSEPNQSPFLAMRRVEEQVKTLLRDVDVDTLNIDEKKLTSGLKRLLVDVRLDIRDYELSETRPEQIKCAVIAKKRLAKLEKTILAAGTLFGVADVAHLSAQTGQIDSRLI